MNTSEHTLQQIGRALKKVAQKFKIELENQPLTDIHIQVNPESGELLVFNDEDIEITRCVVEEWINNHNENFYDIVKQQLLKAIQEHKEELENLCILKPYSFLWMKTTKRFAISTSLTMTPSCLMANSWRD